MASGVQEGTILEQRVFVRGDHLSPGELAPKQFPVVLAGEAQKPVQTGSGRLELAKWLASPNHPLTSRVFVNRLWQWHFGEALVRTPNNWGLMGENPTHPELLDFLAKRFVESGWSVKAMHRMIMLSSAYQMNSHVSDRAREADPSNRLFSRFNHIRMSIEQLRDSILALSGSLDSTIGGSLLPTGPQVRGKREQVDPEDLKRRTMYVPVRRGSIPQLLSTFDYGDATTPSDGRTRSNVAPQALFMMNSRFVLERAKEFAKLLIEDTSLSDKQRVERAYLIALTRRPEPAEVDSALTYVHDLEKRLGADAAHLTAWQSFCHILLSTNEFLYLN